MDFHPSKLREQYRTLLSDGVIPFWFRHGVDVPSCMSEDGARISTEKYIWSQARFVWTMAALFNRFEPRPEFLEMVRRAIDFLLAHARDEAGWLIPSAPATSKLERSTQA
jgi:mannose/cellobiose epimerase-like protein (N-acyl-D-glucosamine 2-epimerase family)